MMHAVARFCARPQMRAALLGGLGGVLLACALIFAAAAPALAPYAPNDTDLQHMLQPPAWQKAGHATHSLGTDTAGRDIASRIIWGARASLRASIAACLLAALAGGSLGLCAGFSDGSPGRAISWLIDVQSAFPPLLLAIFLLAVLGGGFGALVFVLALGAWANVARAVRRELRHLRAQDFLLAARSAGTGLARRLRRHLFPALLPSILSAASFSLGQTILAQAALNFLGVGVNKLAPSWGEMLELGRTHLQTAWWMAAFPGLAIALTVLGANLLGEWLSLQFAADRR